MPNIIISDTSCLITFNRIRRLDILQKTFPIIYTTPKVQEEFGAPLPNWIHIKNITDQQQLLKLELVLDAGEASAITLALETEDAILIIDEKKGRRIARELNLNVIGTLKVLLIAKESGTIPLVKPIIKLLEQRSFRLSKIIVEEILKLAKED